MKRVRFPCAICGKKVSSSETRRDHIIPVVDPKLGFPKTLTGEDNWNEYIKRLFVKTEQIQIVCVGCHNIKSGKENKSRKRLTKKKK